MMCPVCRKMMALVQAGDFTVDVCDQGCGGMWFDQLELQRVDEAHEPLPAALTEADTEAPTMNLNEARRNCPKCGDVVMMRFFYSPRRRIQVDHCPNCGGYFLDKGELRDIRELFQSRDERDAEVAAIINDHFGAQIAAMPGQYLGEKVPRSFIRRFLGRFMRS